MLKTEIDWRIIPAAIWWSTWKERNSWCFGSIENSVQKVKLNCIISYVFGVPGILK